MQQAQQTTHESPTVTTVTSIEREIEAAIRGGGRFHGLPEAHKTIDEHRHLMCHGFEQMIAVAETYIDESTVDEIRGLMTEKVGDLSHDDVIEEGEVQRMKRYLSERFATALLLVEDGNVEFRADPLPDVPVSNVVSLSDLTSPDATSAVYIVTYDDGEPVSQYVMGDVEGLLVCGCPDKVYRYGQGLRRCKHELCAALSQVSSHTV